MIDQPRYSLWTVITFGCWVGTAVLAMAAWAIWIVAHEPIVAILTAETACVASAVAAVLQIRCFSVRLGRLVRLLVLGAEGDARDERVRPIR